MSFDKQRVMAPPRHDQEWVIHVSKSFEEGLEEDNNERIPVSIFNVPKTLLSIKQEAYTPQLVSIGPYHHKRLEVFEMDRYKLASARRTQNQLRNIKFRDIVDHFVEYEGSIRACYHRSLEFDRETLGWMFAIDASFLLEFLQTYAAKISIKGPLNGSITRISSKMAHLIDYTRRKTAHHAILRDIIMLENQIPFFLLRELHRFYQHDQNNNPDEILAMMLLGLCKDLSPIKIIDLDPHLNEDCFSKAHLLELLYYMVAPPPQCIAEIEEQCEIAKEQEKTNCFRKSLKCVTRILCSIIWAPICCCEKIVKSKLIIFLIALPWAIIKCFSNVKSKESVKELIDAAEEMEIASALKEDDRSPLVEEIKIPSVSELSDIGIKFSPTTKGGLMTIKFDKNSSTFYLPTINLDDNSEVVLRNLVAYEASIAPEIMLLTRYTELMNGIVDTVEDVKILREAGIIVNRLKSDEEVASLWNGMTKSVRMTKVPVLDKAIENANSSYSSRWSVKMNGIMKKYVFKSWPFLTFLAANVIILLSAVQAVCSIYRCSKWVDVVS